MINAIIVDDEKDGAEVLQFLRPNYVICIHSFTPFYEDNAERKIEIGVLFRQKGRLVEEV